MTRGETLVAGPWAGEFGWELFAWQAYVRALSRSFNHTVIVGRETSKSLYMDFADEYIAVTPTGGDADSYFMHNYDINAAMKEVLMGRKELLTAASTIFVPRRLGNPPHTPHDTSIQVGNHHIVPEYIRFGEKLEKSYDYVFHIRQRSFRNADNWHMEKWKTLRKLLGDVTIACIGIPTEAGWIEGTEDMRGNNLTTTLNILHNAKCVVGPSSGPMHLASLCGAPHLVWGRRNMSLTRYEKNWNPLQTEVLFVEEHGFHPSAQYVYDTLNQWRKK